MTARTIADFSAQLATLPITHVERAVALLWFAGLDNHANGLTVRELCSIAEASGCAAQNRSRLRQALQRDARVIKCGQDGFRVRPSARQALDTTYGDLLIAHPLPKVIQGVVPEELFAGARPYIRRVVEQLNASYHFGLYDCCAVMCRRLLETLIIEAYEHEGRATEIRSSDGNFLMLSGLVGYLKTDPKMNLGRETLRGIEGFKRLGDLSAHDRRFNARKADIDSVRDGLRVASEALLHLSGQSV